MQSKENYQREHMVGPTYFTEINEKIKNENEGSQDGADEFEIFERAQIDQNNIYSQRSRYNDT